MTELEQVEELIQKSGNSFHCKVIDYLQGKGWTVLISPYYNDNVTDKPREIDLIAEKVFHCKDNFGNYIGDIKTRLFVECKYIPQLSVFWFHKKDIDEAIKLVEKTTPINKKYGYPRNHHYLRDTKVAKLFTSDNQKNLENDPFYKALNQSLNAMIYFKDRSYRDQNISCILNYPVILCNGFDKFYQVDIELNPNKDPVKIVDNFLLEVNYAYINTSKNNMNEYFLIDVLAYEKIDSFLENLQEEIDAMRDFLPRK